MPSWQSDGMGNMIAISGPLSKRDCSLLWQVIFRDHCSLDQTGQTYINMLSTKMCFQ